MNFYIKRKDRIILTAIEILDESGFQGLSTKEICRRQEVSEGALYKHFKSKNEVILGVLDYYFKFDDEIKQTVELKKLSPKESIQYFAARFAEYYENYPAMTAILNSYEILRHEDGIAHKITEISESRFDFIKCLVDEGKNSGEFDPATDSESLSDMILGAFSAITLKWRIRQYNFSLKHRMLSTVEMILKAY